MKTMRIGRSDIVAPVVGLGAWAIGGDSNWGSSDDAESVKTIHRAADLGMNLVDSAPAYGMGHSEEVVGKALRGRRDRYILSTKCGLRWDRNEGSLHMERDGIRLMRDTRPESVTWELESSLRRLATDYIDIYIVHWQARPDFPVPIADTMGALLRAKERGLIRAIGAANLERRELLEYLNNGGIDLVQEKYSMLDRGVEARLLDLCGSAGPTLQAYSPLERGALTGKYGESVPGKMGLARSKVKWFQPEHRPALAGLAEAWAPLCAKYHCTMTQLVISWTGSQGAGVQVLSGARTVAQVEENAGGGGITIDAADRDAMRRAVEALD